MPDVIRSNRVEETRLTRAGDGFEGKSFSANLLGAIDFDV
jgi:hypothetical protein